MKSPVTGDVHNCCQWAVSGPFYLGNVFVFLFCFLFLQSFILQKIKASLRMFKNRIFKNRNKEYLFLLESDHIFSFSNYTCWSRNECDLKWCIIHSIDHSKLLEKHFQMQNLMAALSFGFVSVFKQCHVLKFPTCHLPKLMIMSLLHSSALLAKRIVIIDDTRCILWIQKNICLLVSQDSCFRLLQCKHITR